MEIKKDKTVSHIQYNPELFHNNQQFYLVYRKIEHVTSAIFLISGLIENQLVLKQAIQEHGLKCLSYITSLIGKTGVGISDIQRISAQILHLNSLMDIGFWSGVISQMNLTIIQQEISVIHKTLNDISSSYKNSFFISGSFFKTDKDMLNDFNQKDTSNSINKGFNKDDFYKRQHKGLNIKDTSNGQNTQDMSHTENVNKGQRKEAILSLLKEKTNLTVKDFLSVVPNCSEKTIQRDLLNLMGQGLVRKEGERRWSTYFIVN